MARARRSTNTHAARISDLPFAARLRREEAFRSADIAEWKAAADRIAGPAGWYAMAGWAPADVDCKLILFATAAEAEAMQRWIAESGTETRSAPRRYNGPQLTVAGVKPS
ncbi:MAG: hypothetical protein HQ465_19930 [Rhodospirillales bacterium]|nr:hypothetical protein [Rhodospirillales bacterium]